MEKRIEQIDGPRTTADRGPLTPIERSCTEQHPIALAILGRDVESRWNSRTWQVLCCPLCGGWHRHGAGKGDQDPRRYLGSRSRHCAPNDVEPDAPLGYTLREAGPEESRILKLIAKNLFRFHLFNPGGELVSWHRKRSTALLKLKQHPECHIINANVAALQQLLETNSCV